MNKIMQSAEFEEWLDGLRDLKAKLSIDARLRRAGLGNFGDCDPVGHGVSEMRIDVGAGYRVYFTRRGEVTYLLCGGDKSTQKRDVKRAIKMAQELED
jgi:putative addiction module killer protein